MFGESCRDAPRPPIAPPCHSPSPIVPFIPTQRVKRTRQEIARPMP